MGRSIPPVLKHVRGHTAGVVGALVGLAAAGTAVEPTRRLAAEYVDGAFLGTNAYTLDPVDDGRQTLLAMHFQASPQGWLRHLARVADLGAAHSSATRAAFARLDALVRERRTVARSGR